MAEDCPLPKMDLILSSNYLPSQGTVLRDALPRLPTTKSLSMSLEMSVAARGPPRAEDHTRVDDFLKFFKKKPSAPVLHTFALSATRSTPGMVIPDNTLFVDLSQIRVLQLRNWNLDWNVAVPATFENITQLSIILDPHTSTGNHVPRADIYQILPVLEKLHDLQFLELQRACAKTVSGEPKGSPRWTKLKQFRVVDFYDNLSVIFTRVAYPAIAEVSLVGLRRSAKDGGTAFENNKSLFRKLVQRNGDKINVLKVEQRPTEDQHTLTGWIVEEGLPWSEVEKKLNGIPHRIKLEGPSTREDITTCLLKTNLDNVEHAIIGRRPLSREVWRQLGCQNCLLQSLRVVGDDLNLIEVLRETPPPEADQAGGGRQPEYYFHHLDRLHLENWAMNAPMSMLTSESPSDATRLRPAFTAEGQFTNWGDLRKVIRMRAKRGYGPRNLIISPIEGPLERRIRKLVDYCEGAGLLNMPLLQSDTDSDSDEDSESDSE